MSTNVVDDVNISDDEYDSDNNDETFFNKDSYKAFIKKNNIQILDDNNYINNDLHKINIVTPNNYRQTSEIMTLAEYTRVISERASQIQNGSVIFIDIGNETDLIKIAKLEISLKKSPMKITRSITTNIVEIWEVNEMIVPKK
jgi:DNA-directed RNA polymerase subunit K/omega